MTHSTYPMVGVPVTRAVRYPHVIGPDADLDGDIEAVEVTQLTVDTDVKVVGRVTLSAMADPDDAWGFEFDLDPADALELAKRLVEAASCVDPDQADPLDGGSTPVRNMTGITDIATEPQGETEQERIEQLVLSSASPQEDGEVVVWVHACEEPWVVTTGMRLTEDDAWALADVLRQAASLVAGSEPQAFIRLRLFDDDTP